MREQFWRAAYNHLIKKLNICNIPLSESEEYDIWWILSMYSLLRVSLYVAQMTFTQLKGMFIIVYGGNGFKMFLIKVRSWYII